MTKFRVNYGRGALSPETDQKKAIFWYKGLAGYKKYAQIEKYKEQTEEWVKVKLVEKAK